MNWGIGNLYYQPNRSAERRAAEAKLARNRAAKWRAMQHAMIAKRASSPEAPLPKETT